MKRDSVKILIMLFSSVIIFLMLTRCEVDDIDYENIDCQYCYTEHPDLSYLEITFSEGICDSVDITVYRGYVDDGLIEWSGKVAKSPFKMYETPVTYLYSVKATYLKDSVSISVVDSDKMETHLIQGICDDDCFIITGGEYDVEFKK
jgi:hypothetical protein